MVVWERVRRWWAELPAARRLLLAGGLLALALTAVLWSVLAQPRYAPLEVGTLDTKGAADVVDKLKELKVSYRLSGDGTSILVPEADRVTARLALAQAGLPQGSGSGYELFDTQKFGATDADRRVEYKRAMEGELARAIGRLAGVQYANVKLALPDPSLFLKDQQPATAAVLVQPVAGRQLTADQVQGIVRFVSSAIEGLTPEHVTVIDDRGQVLSGGSGQADPGAAGGERLKAQMMAQDYLQQKVQALLAPVFGPGNVVAQVAVGLDWDQVTSESTQFTGVQPRSTQTQSKTSTSTQGSGATPPAAAVPPTNQATGGTVPSYQTGGGSGSSQSDERTTVVNNEVSSEKTTTVAAPGRIKTLSVGVLINGQSGQAVLTAAQTEQVRQTVASATGAAPANVTITVLPFSQDLLKALTPPAPAAKPGLASGWLTAVALAFGLVALLFVLRRRRPAPAPVLPDLAAQRATVVPLPVRAAAEQSDIEAVAAAVAAAAAEEPNLEELASQIVGAPERNRAKAILEAMIKQNPEMVAQLLKGWIGED